nr:hypothetical protein [Tanacetum cinerariifolium]
MRLQALVDKKKVVVTEATIRDALRLDDAEGVECLPNKEIFAELARMGYENPSTKLTFYKEFSQASRKFNFSKKQVGDLSSHSTKYTSYALTQKVFANMRRVGKGFSRVDTPLFEGMLVAQEVGEDADEVHAEDVNATSVATERVVTAASDDVNAAVEEPSIPSPTPLTLPPQPSQDIPSTSQDKIAQALEITKLKSRVKKLGRRNKAFKLKRLKKERMIANIDADADVVLEEDKDVAADIVKDVEDSAHNQRRKAESQAKIYKIDLEHAKKVLSMQEEESEPIKLQEVLDVVTTAKIIIEVVTAISITIIAADVLVLTAITAAAPTLTAAPSRRRKGVVIRDPKESTTTSTIIHSEAKSKDKGKGILVEEPKPLKKALKRLNESQEDKEAKKQKLDEEVEELKRHLQIVPNEEDDVYTEATPLARKVLVVDYEIYNEDNLPYYKIKRADGSHQLYLSFLSLHRNFDRKDLEALWRLVKERFATTKPKTFFDDFLLITLEAMFEKPDIHAQIWKNQRSVHERRYPLIRFALDQMLNNVRLKVKEESEVSLELLSFGVDAAEESQGKHAK